MTEHGPEVRRAHAGSAAVSGITKKQGKMSLRQFKQHATYRASGVEWLGEIPAHWDVAPVYARYRVELGKMLDAKRITGEASGRYLRNVDVQWDAVNTDNLPQMDFTPSDRYRYRLRQGDLLVCEGGEVGRTAIWRGEIAECFYQKAIHRVRPRLESELPRFFYYLMLSLSHRGVFVSGGNANTIDHLTSVQLRHYRFPFPPPPEQQTIVSFLDLETTKLDALIAMKQQLLELLQEQRTALINRAVTKGLDQTIAMKDSGVDWLGEIPRHWEIIASRQLTSRIEQGWSPVAEDRTAGLGEWAVIKLSAVHKGTFLSHEHKALPIDVEPDTRYEIHEGDFLLTRANTPDLVGDVCVAHRVRSKLMLCDLVYRLRFRDHRASPSFLAYWLGSPTGRYQIEVDARGASQSMVKVSQGHIRAWTLVLPPLDEQRAITTFLDRETAKIDALIAKVREAIDRLKELRIALISAAVTGKIDVRDEVA